MWTWEASELVLYRYVLPFFIVRTHPALDLTRCEVVFQCSINYWTVSVGWIFRLLALVLCDWWPTKPFKLYAWRPGLIYAQACSCFRTLAHSPRNETIIALWALKINLGRNFWSYRIYVLLLVEYHYQSNSQRGTLARSYLFRVEPKLDLA
jgi:hypothetical protein